MGTPPIGPSIPPPAFPPEEGPPLRERVHKDLQLIQQTAADLQKSLASQESASQIQDLFQNLQKPIQDLSQLTHQTPPVLSQNEIDVIKSISVQYEMMQLENVNAPGIAAMQGSAATLEQMFEAEVSKTPEPNSFALQAQNFLSALSHVLDLHLHRSRINPSAIAVIVSSMKNPMDELSHLTEKGILTQEQSDIVKELLKLYTSVMQNVEVPTDQTLDQFQSRLQSLNQLLIGP